MPVDPLQQAWQSQPQRTLRIDADVLLAQVRRNQRNLAATIFWRDFREVVVALALVVWFAISARELGWQWLSFSAACAWIAGYILVDRWRHRGERPAADQTLASSIEDALREVEHQIWLLKNVAWWYLGPPMLAAIFTIGHRAFTDDDSLTDRLLEAAGPLGTFVVVFAGIYWLNQYAVRTELQPRRQELLAVREGLMQSVDQPNHLES
jgi:hypothetical protein